MLTAAQVKLVQDSWQLVAPNADQAADLFFRKLFELDASLKGLFKGDLKRQGRRLIELITLAVAHLDDLDGIFPDFRRKACRPSDYKVKGQDYDTLGKALIWTLETGLGPAMFTEDCREAWAVTYGIMAGPLLLEAANA